MRREILLDLVQKIVHGACWSKRKGRRRFLDPRSEADAGMMSVVMQTLSRDWVRRSRERSR